MYIAALSMEKQLIVNRTQPLTRGHYCNNSCVVQGQVIISFMNSETWTRVLTCGGHISVLVITWAGRLVGSCVGRSGTLSLCCSDQGHVMSIRHVCPGQGQPDPDTFLPSGVLSAWVVSTSYSQSFSRRCN